MLPWSFLKKTIVSPMTGGKKRYILSLGIIYVQWNEEFRTVVITFPVNVAQVFLNRSRRVFEASFERPSNEVIIPDLFHRRENHKLICW